MRNIENASSIALSKTIFISIFVPPNVPYCQGFMISLKYRYLFTTKAKSHIEYYDVKILHIIHAKIEHGSSWGHVSFSLQLSTSKFQKIEFAKTFHTKTKCRFTTNSNFCAAFLLTKLVPLSKTSNLNKNSYF